MVTKSRIWAAVSFAAFFLGVTLAVTAAGFFISAGTDGIRDAFAASYFDTAAFRGLASDCFWELAHNALDDFPQSPEEAGLVDPDNRNLLYYLQSPEGTYTNMDDAYIADAEKELLPDRYGLLVVYDGHGTSIIRDGQRLDNLMSWNLPFRDEPLAYNQRYSVILYLAFATDPLPYEGNESYSSRTYEIVSHMWWARESCFQALAGLLAGLVLLACAFVRRADFRRANGALARITGHIWFEPKLAALLLAVWGVAIQLVRFWPEFHFEPCVSLAAVQVCFWVIYLFVNDLRGNPNSPSRSLCASVAALLRTRELSLPFQKRMAQQGLAALVFGGLFAASALTAALLGVPLQYNLERREWVAIATVYVLPAVLGAAMVLELHRTAKRVSAAARDVGLLTERITDIREGRLHSETPLPKDPDLRRAAQALETAGQGMQKALEREIKSERLKVELITNVSHDLKTPLTSIISYTELLKQEEDLPPHVRDYVRILDEKSRRLKTMVQDVFEISKAASGQLPVNPEALDFAKLLRQTLADMAERIEAAPVSVRSEIPETAVMITADGERLYRVFQNLIQNALQYSLEGSRVYVTLTAQNGTATAAVKNTSREPLSPGTDYTERFLRGDASRADGGSGLGLSIASSFTQACGGAFSIETDADLFTAQVAFPYEAAALPEPV